VCLFGIQLENILRSCLSRWCHKCLFHFFMCTDNFSHKKSNNQPIFISTVCFWQLCENSSNIVQKQLTTNFNFGCLWRPCLEWIEVPITCFLFILISGHYDEEEKAQYMEGTWYGCSRMLARVGRKTFFYLIEYETKFTSTIEWPYWLENSSTNLFWQEHK
jgi:hypothetical protein